MLTIHPTTAEDLLHVVALETAADTSTWLGETGLSWHEHALADPDQEHLVTTDDATLTGFVVLAGLHNHSGTVELRRMVVHRRFRGTGQGRALLRAALTRAYDHHHARRVWLDVKPHNLRARTLYQSEGFISTELPPAPNDPSSDLIIMTHTRH